MTPLLLLAEKVEGMDGPSDRIDECIWQKLNPGKDEPAYTPGYCFSVDSALLLVPHGYVLHALGQSQSPSDEMRPWLAMVVQRDASLSTGRTSYAATPALALVAASLRARAAMEAGE